MIIIPPEHPIVQRGILDHLNSEKRDKLTTSILSDFDGTIYKLCRGSPGDPSITTLITLSMRAAGYKSVAESLGEDFLQNTCYAPYLQETEVWGDVQFDVTITADVSTIDATDDGYAKFASEWAGLKRNVLGYPLMKAFAGLVDEEATLDMPNMAIDFRPQESIYVCPLPTKVTTVFRIAFLDPVDMEIGRVFLEEFTVARKGSPALGAAPIVSFTPGPPGEVRAFVDHRSLDAGAAEAQEHAVEVAGYLSLTFEARHVESAEKLSKAVDLLFSFRAYLQYHIKCCKSYMQTRMRHKADDLQKVFNQCQLVPKPARR